MSRFRLRQSGRYVKWGLCKAVQDTSLAPQLLYVGVNTLHKEAVALQGMTAHFLRRRLQVGATFDRSQLTAGLRGFGKAAPSRRA